MRAKLESGFEDVSSLIFIDFAPVLVSLLGAKIVKKRTKNQVYFRNDFGCDFGRFCVKMGSNRGRPGGMRGAAGGLKDLKESDKSCNGASQHALHLGKPRAADSRGFALPPTPSNFEDR